MKTDVGNEPGNKFFTLLACAGRIGSLLFAMLLSIGAQAALIVDVSVDAPDTFVGQPNVIYENELDPASEGANLADQQLIWLGLHETTGFNADSSDNTVSVHLQNLSGGTLEGFSLVLSSAEASEWNFTIDDGITINNIFVFSVFDQSYSGDVNLGLVSEFGGASVCGFALDAAEYGGCDTDEILGTTGLPFPLGPNYLDDMTSLHVTNFNGAYAVDGFSVGLSAVPLPGTLVFMLSGLVSLIGFKRLFG